MDATQISLARVSDLDIAMSWREAAAVLAEAVLVSRRGGGSADEPLTPDACVMTRGGQVLLVGPGAQAAPIAVAALADDLLRLCREPGRLREAVRTDSVLAFVDEFCERSSPNIRRRDIASLALRALAAEADFRAANGGPLDAESSSAVKQRPWPRVVAVRGPREEPIAVPPPEDEPIPWEEPTIVRSRPPTPPPRRTGFGAVALTMIVGATAAIAWLNWPTLSSRAAPSPSTSQDQSASAPETATRTVPADDPPTPTPGLPDESPEPEPASVPPVAPDPTPVAPLPPSTAASTPVVEPTPPTEPYTRPPGFSGDEPIFSSLSDDVQPPVLVSPVPPGTRILGPGDSPGSRVLHVLVDQVGRVEDAQVVEGGGGLDREARRAIVSAARRWRFVPASRDGQPVRYTVRVTVRN